MSLKVELKIFSGRPNPTWILDDDQEEEFQRFAAQFQRPTLSKPSGVLGRLGYRGFAISRHHQAPSGGMEAFIHEGIMDTGSSEVNWVSDNRDLEAWLLTTAPRPLDRALTDHIQDELAHPPFDPTDYFDEAASPCPHCFAADAPTYNAEIWNVPNVQPYNNCYNYANNQMTNTFAQPGRAHGQQAQNINCSEVNLGAQADGLLNTNAFNMPLAPGAGWYVALVIWPDFDYHWYRQDQVGCWSHKPGSGAARNTDNSGYAIKDPQTCNRGPYSIFCTYMITNKNILIR